MSLEAFLARLYVDEAARLDFTHDPRRAAERAGLTPPECDALCRIDLEDLEFAAQSFAAKRSSPTAGRIDRLGKRIRRWFSGGGGLVSARRID